MSKITCLIKEPAKPIKFARVDNEIHTFQSIVGGFVEMHKITRFFAILCNEEGRIKRLPYSCTVEGVHYVGPVIFIGLEDEEFCSLDLSVDELIEYIPVDDLYKEDIWTFLVD